MYNIKLSFCHGPGALLVPLAEAVPCCPSVDADDDVDDDVTVEFFSFNNFARKRLIFRKRSSQFDAYGLWFLFFNDWATSEAN